VKGHKREGNRPDRRIAPAAASDRAQREALACRIVYAGSAHHKRRPGDYGFQPPVNPRPSKDICDAKDKRQILLDEARLLLAEGVRRGMFSTPGSNGLPKYVWAVDTDGDVFEAKTRPERETEYHGYRLGDDDELMRRYVSKEWTRDDPAT
jgi:hypothetical protein